MSIPHLFSVAAVVLASFAAPAASSGPGEDEDRLSGADLSAWREKTGAWRVVADVGLDPRDERRLAGRRARAPSSTARTVMRGAR
jgi:hypothetical protein